MKLEGFLDEGDATKIALYLRSNSPKSKHKLFKAMSPEARIVAIKMEKEQAKLPKRKNPKEMPTINRPARTFRDDPAPFSREVCPSCGSPKYADADSCERCSQLNQGWV